MANARRDLDTTGQTVADHLRRLRRERNLTPTQMSRLLGELGRPLSTVAVLRMENGQRAVDTDDLTALAVLFGVSPLTLLMPNAEGADTPVTVTGAGRDVRAEAVLDWLAALSPLDEPADARGVEVDRFLFRAKPGWAKRFPGGPPGGMERALMNLGTLLRNNPAVAGVLAEQWEQRKTERKAGTDGDH